MTTITPEMTEALKKLSSTLYESNEKNRASIRPAVQSKSTAPYHPINQNKESINTVPSSNNSENTNNDYQVNPMFARYKLQLDALQERLSNDDLTEILFFAVNHYYNWIFKQQ